MKATYRLATCVLAAGLSTMSSGALAQVQSPSETAPPANVVPTENGGVADIIVTAERREQSVQRAPLTIQVIDSSQLTRAGLSDAAGLQRLTTGVEIGMGGANSQIFIRGVGSQTFSPLSSPGVAFNVDGIYVGRPDGVNGNFYDVARVEVIKGPQGTLYGRNANGGSINLITNDPRLGRAQVDMSLEGGNFNLIHGTAALNLPLGDTAGIRAAINIVNRDGYISDGTNDDVQQSGRLRLRWEPSADVSVLLNADYTHLGGEGGDYVYLPQRPGASPYEAQTTPVANAYMHGFSFLGPLHDDVVANSRQDTTLYNFSGQLDWDLHFATLTLIPAYRHTDSNYVTHIANFYESHATTDQTTGEARLGNSSSRLSWLIGGYYFDEGTDDGLVTVRVSNILQNYLIAYAPHTRAYAAFGQATFSVLDNLRVIVGGRYTYERQNVSGRLSNAATTPPTLLEVFGGRTSFDGFTYKVGLEYDLSPRNMIFATYSTGFKAGGFSQTIPPLAVYQPEHLDALEVGSRNRFLQNRLQVNFGGYYWKYRNLQDTRVNFDPLGNVNLITFNSGSATLYGANFDVVASLTPADRISLSGEYVHSEYDRYFFQTPVPFFLPGSSGCAISGPYAPGATLPYTASGGGNTNAGPLPVVVGNCAGFQMARVPKWSANLAYSHIFTLPASDTITVDGSVKYASARWLGIDFIPAERDGAYATVDASITYSSRNSRWSVALFGRNLTKTVYYTGGIQTAFLGGLIGANIAPPRTYGLRLNLSLGN
jgi:iron complex outermembrane receptor protein